MSVKWLFLLSLTTSYAQDPRKRQVLPSNIISGSDENELIDEDTIACSVRGCVKRFHEEIAPFWANRGKKDPRYLQNHLYAQEPKWIYINDANYGLNEPFFITRGKKSDIELNKQPTSWSFKEFMQEKRADSPLDNPFFAARGKKKDHRI